MRQHVSCHLSNLMFSLMDFDKTLHEVVIQTLEKMRYLWVSVYSRDIQEITIFPYIHI